MEESEFLCPSGRGVRVGSLKPNGSLISMANIGGFRQLRRVGNLLIKFPHFGTRAVQGKLPRPFGSGHNPTSLRNRWKISWSIHSGSSIYKSIPSKCSELLRVHRPLSASCHWYSESGYIQSVLWVGRTGHPYMYICIQYYTVL